MTCQKLFLKTCDIFLTQTVFFWHTLYLATCRCASAAIRTSWYKSLCALSRARASSDIYLSFAVVLHQTHTTHIINLPASHSFSQLSSMQFTVVEKYYISLMIVRPPQLANITWFKTVLQSRWRQIVLLRWSTSTSQSRLFPTSCNIKIAMFVIGF